MGIRRIFYPTIGAWVQGVVGLSGTGYIAHWPLVQVVSLVQELGYHCAVVDVYGDDPEPFVSYRHVCLGAPTDEPVGLRHALISGAAAVGNGFGNRLDVEEPPTFAEIEAMAEVGAQLLADMLDFATTGSAEPPIAKFISCAAESLWTWTFIIPVASDSEWLTAQYQFRSWNTAVLGTDEAEGPTPMPAASEQVCFPTGVEAGALFGVEQAIKDAGARSTLIGVNNTGPLWVVESGEVLEEPEE